MILGIKTIKPGRIRRALSFQRMDMMSNGFKCNKLISNCLWFVGFSIHEFIKR